MFWDPDWPSGRPVTQQPKVETGPSQAFGPIRNRPGQDSIDLS